jgi:hypothetical membrane protein
MLVLIKAPEGAQWKSRETVPQGVLLSIGIIALILLGIFPQWVLPLWTKLQFMFIKLGQY